MDYYLCHKVLCLSMDNNNVFRYNKFDTCDLYNSMLGSSGEKYQICNIEFRICTKIETYKKLIIRYFFKKPMKGDLYLTNMLLDFNSMLTLHMNQILLEDYYF